MTIQSAGASTDSTRLKMIIHPTELCAYNLDNGVEFPIRDVDLKLGERIHWIGHLTPGQFSAAGELDVELRAAGADPKALTLAAPVRKRLLGYLRAGGPPRHPFDSGAFIDHLLGRPTEIGWFTDARWRRELVRSEEELRVGDVIAVGRDLHRLAILALSLGEGLYLAKFGMTKFLIITDLPALRRGFDGDTLYRLTPAAVDPLVQFFQ